MQPTEVRVFQSKWLFGVAAAFLLPIFGYLVLPQMGIGVFQNVFQLKQLLLLFGGLVGAVVYWQYFCYVQARPQLLVAFIALAWPIVAYCNSLLLGVGINVHLTPLLVMLIAVPCFWQIVQNGLLVFQQLPWVKYYFLFVAWLIFYAIFYNVNMVDPRLGGGGSGEGSVAFVQVMSYMYCLLGMMISGITVLKARQPQVLFDFFNKALILVVSLESLVTILGFPFGLFNIQLDGFTRAVGIFGHPNPYAHHMGVLMVYLLGLFCYYQGERSNRMPGWLLFVGLGVNGVAFLLGLSKTALGVFSLCAMLMLLLNLQVPAVRRGFGKIAIAALILGPIGLIGYQMLSGESLFSVLESRIEQTQSMSWRTQVWQELLANINMTSVWFGHGLSSANEVVYRATSISDDKSAQPLMMVHNAYIGLVYDLGLLGYLMFMSALSLSWNALKGWMEAAQSIWRTELSIILALVLYFLLVCGFDEMAYMFDAPMLVWVFCSILFCLTLRAKAENARTEGRFQ